MEANEKIKTLQMMYAGVLADAVLRLGREGVLDKVTAQKRAEQLITGKARAAQMGIGTPQEIFVKLPELMGCSDWSTKPNEDGQGFTAQASHCMLCALAKKMGAQSPCHIYCLDPMEGMTKGLDENAELEVQETLYDGSRCRVEVRL